MDHLKYRITFAILIPMLFINLCAGAILGAAHAAKELEHSSPHSISVFNAASDDHCPACPHDDHHSNDHSHHSYEHHSSLYFGYQTPLISYNPSVTIHTIAEPFNAFPEVYPEKFIPPQIHT